MLCLSVKLSFFFWDWDKQTTYIDSL
jgi:hypothetical protein